MKTIFVILLGLCALAAAYPSQRDDEISEMKRLLQEIVERKKTDGQGDNNEKGDDHDHHEALEKAEEEFLHSFEEIIHQYLVERKLIKEKDGEKEKNGEKGGNGGNKNP